MHSKKAPIDTCTWISMVKTISFILIFLATAGQCVQWNLYSIQTRSPLIFGRIYTAGIVHAWYTYQLVVVHISDCRCVHLYVHCQTGPATVCYSG